MLNSNQWILPQQFFKIKIKTVVNEGTSQRPLYQRLILQSENLNSKKIESDIGQNFPTQVSTKSLK